MARNEFKRSNVRRATHRSTVRSAYKANNTINDIIRVFTRERLIDRDIHQGFQIVKKVDRLGSIAIMTPRTRSASGQLLLEDKEDEEAQQLAPPPPHRCDWKYVWDEIW
mmetsp:Transcript_31590/g.52146  ORF Transcript_31590/g.52146 Transcript_31590/m.52146 type:complete len:109 (+) Transcript_31590:29-355(+)